MLKKFGIGSDIISIGHEMAQLPDQKPRDEKLMPEKEGETQSSTPKPAEALSVDEQNPQEIKPSVGTQETKLKLKDMEILPEFKERLKEIHDLMSALYSSEQERESLIVGPKYITRTSQNEEVVIETLVVNDTPGRRGYRLFAEDITGRIIAEANFIIDASSPYAYVWNLDLMTGVRAQGVGSRMVAAYENILQLEANRLGHQLNAPVSDHNLLKLRQAETALAEDANNAALQAKYQAKLAERARWEETIGKRKTVFKPDGSSSKIEDIIEVDLTTSETKYKEIAKSEETSQQEQNKTRVAQMIERLK